MNRFLLPVSVVGTVIGGTVLLKDYVAGGACPSKATIPGKTVIVTGANTGIGKQTALELAKRGGNIILACRDMEKCEAAAKDIRGETLNPRVRAQHLDLSSLKSIREFAQKVIKGLKCKICVNGEGASHGTPYLLSISEDERDFLFLHAYVLCLPCYLTSCPSVQTSRSLYG